MCVWGRRRVLRWVWLWGVFCRGGVLRVRLDLRVGCVGLGLPVFRSLFVACACVSRVALWSALVPVFCLSVLLLAFGFAVPFCSSLARFFRGGSRLSWGVRFSARSLGVLFGSVSGLGFLCFLFLCIRVASLAPPPRCLSWCSPSRFSPPPFSLLGGRSAFSVLVLSASACTFAFCFWFARSSVGFPWVLFGLRFCLGIAFFPALGRCCVRLVCFLPAPFGFWLSSSPPRPRWLSFLFFSLPYCLWGGGATSFSSCLPVLCARSFPAGPFFACVFVGRVVSAFPRLWPLARAFLSVSFLS